MSNVVTILLVTYFAVTIIDVLCNVVLKGFLFKHRNKFEGVTMRVEQEEIVEVVEPVEPKK